MRRAKGRNRAFLIFLLCLLSAAALWRGARADAAGKRYKTYTISPDTKPWEGLKPYTRKDLYGYGAKTKQFLTLRSYLERLEREGGGTLVLKKGTYRLSNCLYVPSNVTIRFRDGVRLVKLKNGSALGMFQLVSAGTAYRHGEKKYRGYGGEKKIRFLGEGTVLFDLKYVRDAHCIVMCHNTDVEIKGITFQNMYGSHFIEMDASKRVKIENCTFRNFKRTERANEEAINIDTPDAGNNAMHAEWSSFDRTPCADISIRGNVFEDLEKAVGTHKYSEGKSHVNIRISGNTIRRMHHDAIVCMNYRDFEVRDNVISDTVTDNPGKNIGYRGIALAGVANPTVTGNSFYRVPTPIEAYKWKNTGPGSQYAAIPLVLSGQNKDDLKHNQARECGINDGMWIYPELKTKNYRARYFLSFEACKSGWDYIE